MAAYVPVGKNGSGFCMGTYTGNLPEKGVFHFPFLVSYSPGSRIGRFVEITLFIIVRKSARGS